MKGWVVVEGRDLGCRTDQRIGRKLWEGREGIRGRGRIEDSS